ncbi:MAG: phage tail tape measure protein, partial [Candidatus Nealsonbacteria bacterium]
MSGLIDNFSDALPPQKIAQFKGLSDRIALELRKFQRITLPEEKLKDFDKQTQKIFNRLGAEFKTPQGKLKPLNFGDLPKKGQINVQDMFGPILRQPEKLWLPGHGTTGLTGNFAGYNARAIHGTRVQLKDLGAAAAAALKRFLAWSAGVAIFFGVQKAVRDTVSTVIEFEKQMIRLKQVLPPVVSNLEEIEKGVFKTARTYGQSVSEIQQAMVIWAQQGRNVQEILEGTNNAALLANTTTLTLAQSIELLTVGVGVFNKDFKDMGEIVDSVNVIEQRHALTANDLLRALQRTGSSAHELGLSLNEYFGIIAGIVPKTRESGQRIGTALKTIFGRVVRPQFIDEVAKYGIEVSKTGLELRDLMDILKDIANVWDSLTEIQKVNIARAAGGYRQYAIGMTLFSNFEEVLRAVTDAEFSRGASMRENLVTMESVSKKIQVMRASLDELKKSLGDSGLKGFITDIIGLITKGSDFLNSLSGTSKKLTLGGGGSILGGLGLAAGGIQATKFLNVLVGGTGFASYGQAQKTIVKGIVSGKLEPEALRDFDSYLSTVNGALAKQRVSLYLLQRSQLKNLEGMKALYQSLGLLATMATGVAAYFAILKHSTKQLEQTEKSLAEERKKSITGSASPETIKAATRQRAVVGAEQFAGTAGVVSLLVPQKLRSLALVLSSLLTYKKYQKIIKEQEKDLRRELTLTVDTAIGNAQQMSSEFSKIISLLQTPIDKRDMQWFTNFEEASDTITKRINTLKKEFGNLDVFGKLQGAISGKNLRQVENIARVLNAAAQAKAGKIGLIEQQTTLAGKTKLTPEEIDNAISAASLNILSMARFAAMAGVSLDKFQKTIPSDKFIKEIREGMEKVATKAFLTEKGIQLSALPSTFAKSFLSTQQIARQTGVQTTGISGIKMENLTREFAAALAKEQKSGLFQAIAKTAQGYVTGIFDATGKLIGVFDAGGKQLDKEFTQMAKTFRVVVPLVQKQLLSIWTPEHQKRMLDAFSTMISNIGDEAMRAFGQKDMVSDFKKSILEMNFAVQDAIKKGQITSGGLAEPYARSEIVREFRGQIEKALRGMSAGGDILSKLRKTTYEQTRANAAAIEAFLTRSPKLAQISKSTKTPDEIKDLIDTTFDSIRERIKDIPGGFYALSEIQRQFTSLATKGGKETGFDEFGQKLVASLTKGIEDFNKVQAQVFSKMKSGVINPLLSAYSKLESRGTAIKNSMESLFDVGLVENLSSISGFYNSQVSALQKVKAQEEDINRIRFEGQAKITELLKKSFDDMIQKGLQTFGMSRKQQREQRKAFRDIARTIGGLRLGDLRGLNSAQLQRIGDVTGLSRLSVEDRKAMISALSSVPAGARFPGGQTAKEIKNIIGTIFSGTAEGANAADIGSLLKDSIQTQEKMAYALFGMESKKLSDIYNELVRKLTPIDNTLKRILEKTAASPANKLGFDAREFSNIQSMIENSGVSDISDNTKKIYELLSSKEYSKDLTDAIKEASDINKKELKPSRTKALAKDALGVAGGYAAYEATKYGGKKLLSKIPTKEIGGAIKKKAGDLGFLELIRRGFSKIFSRTGDKIAQEAGKKATEQSTKRLAPKVLKETADAVIKTASKLKGKVPINAPGLSVGGPIAVAGTVAGVAGLSY